jgi:hypothetical protein
MGVFLCGENANLFLVAPLFRREDFAGTGKSLKPRRRCWGVIDLVYLTKKLKQSNRLIANEIHGQKLFWHDQS